jgi:NADH:ubiquinone oxidoreductase subunit D
MQKSKVLSKIFGFKYPTINVFLSFFLELTGKIFIQAEPYIGLLCRGTEKLIVYKTFYKAMLCFDRFDYILMRVPKCISFLNVLNVHLAVEYLLKSQVRKLKLTLEYLGYLFKTFINFNFFFNHG